MTCDLNEVMPRVRNLVAASGLSYSDLALRCNVNELTVRRVLDQPKNPSFILVCDIIVACGGSVDEVIGLPPSGRAAEPSDSLAAQFRADLAYERRRADKNEHVKTLLLLLLVVVLAVVVVDLLNPHVGWIRYGLAQQAAFVQSTTRAVVLCALPWWAL